MMRYLFFRVLRRWSDAPRRPLMFFAQALVALTIVSIGAGTWVNLWRDLSKLHAQAVRQVYIMRSYETLLPGSEAALAGVTEAQYRMLLDEFQERLDPIVLFGQYATFYDDEGAPAWAVPVIVANQAFFELYLGAEKGEVTEPIVATASVLALFETQGLTLTPHWQDAAQRRLTDAVEGRTGILRTAVGLSKDLVHNTVLGKTLDMPPVRRQTKEPIPVPENGYIFLQLEALDTAVFDPTGWPSAFAIVLQQGLSLHDVGPALLARMNETRTPPAPIVFDTAMNTYIMQVFDAWDSALETGVLALVLLFLVTLSLSGWCLALYRARRAQYAACLCVGATPWRIAAELGLELLPPLLAAALCAHAIGSWIQQATVWPAAFTYISYGWLVFIPLGTALVVCAIAMATPMLQLKRLNLPSVLRMDG